MKRYYRDLDWEPPKYVALECGEKIVPEAKERVKAIRKRSGLSQVAFSKEYGIPRRTLENWEAGSRKPPEYVVNLLDKAVPNGKV